MQLRGGTKDESGLVAKVSSITVCVGLVSCQGPAVAVGRTGIKGVRSGECGVGSGLGCMSGYA
jgi:hypothetical protein